MYLNGKRLVIVGVNRHEWSPRTGRCIGMKEMKADMESAKIAEILRETSQLAQKINVNGVPTLILNGQVLQTIDEGVIQNAINALK